MMLVSALMELGSHHWSKVCSLVFEIRKCLVTKILKGFFGSVAVHLSKQHFLDATLDISIERKLGAPRFEPRAAG